MHWNVVDSWGDEVDLEELFFSDEEWDGNTEEWDGDAEVEALSMGHERKQHGR